jgi:hypothetical protein
MPREARMHFAVYDQHQSRLGGEGHLQPLLDESAGFQDTATSPFR